MYKIKSGSIISPPTQLQEGATIDHVEDRSAYLRSDNPVTWSGSQLTFTSDIYLEIVNTRSGTITQHRILSSSSPISLSNGESAWFEIDRTAALETPVLNFSGTLAIPAQSGSDKDVFVLFRRVDVSGAGHLHIPFHKQVLSPGQTVRLGASGSGSSGVAGTDLGTLQYRADITDTFEDQPGSTNSTIDSMATKTTATYSAANKSYAMSYDATLTVTGTGTLMTLSGTPSFPLAIGDMLRVGTEARRITAVGTQTTPTIESAFTVDPSASACTVSQTVHTRDLNQTAFDGVTAFSQFTDTISDFLTTYNDTLTGILFNGTDPANVAFTGSSDGTTYSDVEARVAAPSSTRVITGLPTAGTNLFVRYFSNKTSGSGTVNLVADLRVYWSREVAVESGGFQWQAYAFTDGVGTEVGCTLAVVSGKTYVTFSNSYPVGVELGKPNGPLRVYLNGVKIPRFIDSTLTPDASYTEIDANTIALDQDYSGFNYSVEVVLAQSVVDSNTTNTTSIAAINEHTFKNKVINGNFDFWQRGLSFATPTSGAYTSDRFSVAYDGSIGTFSLSRQSFSLGQANVPHEPTYFLRWDQTVAGSGSTFRVIGHVIESVRTFAGKRATVTFWAKADTTRIVSVRLDQFFGSGGSPSSTVSVVAQNANLTTSWQKFTLTFDVPSISGKTLGINGNDFLAIYFQLPVNTTMTIDLAQVMMNEGSIAAPWNYASGGAHLDFGAELMRCQRYYEKTYSLDVAPATTSTSGTAVQSISSNSGEADSWWSFKVSKRSDVPTITIYSPVTGTINRADSGGDKVVSEGSAKSHWGWTLNSGSAVFGASTNYLFHFTAEDELYA